MRLKFNSYTNELTLESLFAKDQTALKIIKDFLTSQCIEATTPYVEYDPRIIQLLVKLDDTRFKLWNDELQLDVVTDFLDLLNKFGFQTITEFKPDMDVFIEGSILVPDYDTLSNWLVRTEVYPNLISFPYETNRIQEYFLKTIGYWSEADLFEFLKTLPIDIRSQATIRGSEFKKVIMVVEKNNQHQASYLAMQDYVKSKEAIRFMEFGDYRFYTP